MTRIGSERPAAHRNAASPGSPVKAPGRCPLLGTPADPTTAFAFPSDGNHCFKTEKPVPISGAHQEAFCLNGHYVACPIYQHSLEIRTVTPILAPASPVEPETVAPATSPLPRMTAVRPLPELRTSSVDVSWFVPDEYPGEVVEEVEEVHRPPGRYLLFALVFLVLLALTWLAWSSDVVGRLQRLVVVETTSQAADSAANSEHLPAESVASAQFVVAEAVLPSATATNVLPLPTPITAAIAVVEATDSSVPAAAATATEAIHTTEPCVPVAGWSPYILADGETILSLANERGLLPDDLRRANCLSDSDDLRAGSVLLLPFFGIIAMPSPTVAPVPVEPTSTSMPTNTPTRWPTVPAALPTLLPTPTVAVVSTAAQPTALLPTAPPPPPEPPPATVAPTTMPPPTATPPAIVPPTSTIPAPP